MRALLSILALYNYDESIFDKLQLPEGIEKEDVVNNLLMELAELEIIYPNPETIKEAIGFWSKKELPVWRKLYDTTKFDYNPIYNFDRTEETTDKETRNLSGTNNETRNLSGTDKETRDLSMTDYESRDLQTGSQHHSETTGTTQNNGTDIQKEYVSGFNEGSPALAKQIEQTVGTGNSVDGTVDTTDSSTDAGSIDKEITEEGTVNRSTTDTGNVNRSLTDKGTVDTIHTARMFGNIGVTTTQQMIEAERNVVKFNVVNYIIDSFKNRFCILIY